MMKRKRDEAEAAHPDSRDLGTGSDGESEPWAQQSSTQPSDQPVQMSTLSEMMPDGDEADDGHELSTEKPEIEFTPARIQLIRKKIAQYEKKLKPALKVASRFEHQKMIKRHRRANSTQGELDPKAEIPGGTQAKAKVLNQQKLEEEMQALKTLDLSTAATRHIRRLITRNKPLSNKLKPVLPDIFEDIPALDPNSASNNVLARLFNANNVKAVIADMLVTIASIAMVDLSEVTLPKRKNQPDFGSSTLSEQTNQNRLHKPSVASKQNSAAASTPGAGKAKSQARALSPTPSVESEYDADDDHLADDEIAPASDDENEGDRDGDVVMDEDAADTTDEWPGFDHGHVGPTDGDDRMSDYNSQSETSPVRRKRSYGTEEEPEGIPISSLPPDEPSEEEGRKKKGAADKSAAKRQAKKKTKRSDEASFSDDAQDGARLTANSAFIPSLSMNGYMSNADTPSWEYESDEDGVGGGSAKNQKKVTKNRRGQRARRAIWEKKYGAKAKHLVKERENQQKDRNSGWDMRRGAQLEGEDRGKPGWKRDGRARTAPAGPHVHPDRAVRVGGGTGGFSKSQPQGGHRSHPSTPGGHQSQPPQKKAKLPDPSEMHPSWRAKREAKERQKEIASAAVSGKTMNKRIVFD